MEVLKVNGIDLEVNYEDELEQYMDRFEKVRIRGAKLQACSPFRSEKHPSFAVNLENGSWVDSGANEEGERKGSFLTLLAYFRGETYEETAEYLLEKYSHILDDADTLKLDLNLSLTPPEVSVLGSDKYADVINKHSQYLFNRGISKTIQSFFETGLTADNRAVALPWHDSKGRIINIKYRSIQGKEFWFSRDGQQIKNHVYGLFMVKQHGFKEVWAVESEIDALYLWSNGIPAVAFGGASINDNQKQLILNSCIERLVIATDNDTVGRRFSKVLAEEFLGSFQVYNIVFPTTKKDVNELDTTELKMSSENKQILSFNFYVS